MFPPRDGIAFGVSFNPEKHSELYLWAENQTDNGTHLYFCCVSTLFDHIDIYSSDGHRLLSKSDELARKVDPDELVQVCTCSGSVSVPAHTIQLFVFADISQGYTLGPGRYIISERIPVGIYHLKSDEIQELPHTPTGLEISIP